MSKQINEIAMAWREEKRPFVKSSTYAAYMLILQNHILPSFDVPESLNEKHVQAFVLEKLADGLSIKTVKDILIVLKMIMRFGEKNGWISHYEWDIKYPSSSSKPELPVLTIANHKKIMAYVRTNFTFRNLGIYICLSTGIRIGELCALKWSDIDLDGGVITIRRTLERIYVIDGGDKHTELILSTPKTNNSFRDIPISKELQSMLKPLKKIVNEDYYVLTNDSRPSEPRTYRNYYRYLMQQLGIPRIKFHGLRHSFATRCIESNCDYKTVSVILGHSTISTTLNLYVHPNLEQKKRCIDRLSRLLK